MRRALRFVIGGLLGRRGEHRVQARRVGAACKRAAEIAPQPFHDLFDACPDYTPFRDHFWFDWGPVFYRGMDGNRGLLPLVWPARPAGC